MTLPQTLSILFRLKCTLPLVAGVMLSACAQPDPSLTRNAPFDPFEAENRRMHDFNRSLDRTIVRPAGTGYANAIPDDIEMVIGNFAENLSLPSAIVNNILQGNGRGATSDFYRLLVNTTFGLGGLFDTATELEMPAKTGTDFGQTLYVWGVHEGPYLELPLLGPSTTREAVGRTVDLFTNPLSYVLPSPEKYLGTVAGVASSLGQRGRYSGTIDSILYESADSYAVSQSFYLQNRRFKLGMGDGEGYLDPYDTGAAPADPYDTGLTDAYEDPYAE